MKNNITFFGASITQQNDGYAQFFARMNTKFKVSVFGYGSMHLKDAGVCYIDNILSTDPEYCFIDWFSTAYVDEAKDDFDEITIYIDTILNKFYSKGVKLIFLTLPEVVRDKTEIHKRLNEYLLSKNVPTIDISKSFDDLDLILRDGIHSTTYGSEQYSKLISEKFINEFYDKIEIPKDYPSVNKYCDIKQVPLNLLVSKNIIFKGNAEVIGILQYIGPYTGLLKINNEIFNNWDRWCYYEREMVNLKFLINGETKIEILQDEFDTSSCENDCDWKVQKVLKLLTIFYVGDIEKINHE
jgi:hypothetical protein